MIRRDRYRAKEPNAIRKAGWCPQCKEALSECVCHLDDPVDFETPRPRWMAAGSDQDEGA